MLSGVLTLLGSVAVPLVVSCCRKKVDHREFRANRLKTLHYFNHHLRQLVQTQDDEFSVLFRLTSHHEGTPQGKGKQRE